MWLETRQTLLTAILTDGAPPSLQDSAKVETAIHQVELSDEVCCSPSPRNTQGTSAGSSYHGVVLPDVPTQPFSIPVYDFKIGVPGYHSFWTLCSQSGSGKWNTIFLNIIAWNFIPCENSCHNLYFSVGHLCPSVLPFSSFLVPHVWSDVPLQSPFTSQFWQFCTPFTLTSFAFW